MGIIRAQRQTRKGWNIRGECGWVRMLSRPPEEYPESTEAGKGWELLLLYDCLHMVGLVHIIIRQGGQDLLASFS